MLAQQSTRFVITRRDGMAAQLRSIVIVLISIAFGNSNLFAQHDDAKDSFNPDSMAYVLQAEGLGDRNTAVEKLAGCDRDLVVIDYAFFGDEQSRWSREEVDRIRAGKPGRNVLAYLSIGEAGTYRFYWKETWDADNDGKPDADAPAWLLNANPDWPDNFKVHYWDREWQQNVIQHLDEIIEQGFDGVYLDIVDAFEFFEHDVEKDQWIDHRPNPQTNNTYRQDMTSWVTRIASHARQSKPNFLVVPQNGVQLLESDDYRQIISAVGVEDLFTNGNRKQKRDEVKYRMQFIAHAVQAQKPVFLIEYGKKATARQHSIANASEAKLKLLLTDRPLKTLGETPE